MAYLQDHSNKAQTRAERGPSGREARSPYPSTGSGHGLPSRLLDKDVLYYFKERAAQPHAAPYQTQINQELRTIMERDVAPTVDYMPLIQDKKLIAAVAEKVQEYTVKPEE